MDLLRFASCQTDPSPDTWFADPVTEHEDVARARKICLSCPAIDPCRERLSEHEFGTWGGVTLIPLESIQTTAAPEERPAGPLWLRKSGRPESEVRDLLASGVTHEAIASRFGVHVRTIERYVADNGLGKSIPRGASPRRAEVVRLWNEGRTQAHIALQLGVARKTVQNHLVAARAAGVEVRAVDWKPQDWAETQAAIAPADSRRRWASGVHSRYRGSGEFVVTVT